MKRIYKRNAKYWEEETEKIKNEGFEKADKLERKTAVQYSTLKKKIHKELYDFYKKYFKNGEFIGDIYNPISSSELQKLRNSYKKIITEIGIKRSDALGSFNLTKKLNEIDLLLHKINLEFIPQTDLNISQLEIILKESVINTYNKDVFMIQKGTNVLGAFNQISERRIEKIVKKNFKGSTLDKRYNVNKNIILKRMKEEMLEVAAGNKTRIEATKALTRMVDIDYHNASRLIQTETARVMTEADKEAYEEEEVEQFQYVATLDKRTTDICKNNDGKVHYISKMKIGVNAPPLHPRCRSSTIPYFSDISTKRMGRDIKTGKSVYFDETIKTYKDWQTYQNID